MKLKRHRHLTQSATSLFGGKIHRRVAACSENRKYEKSFEKNTQKNWLVCFHILILILHTYFTIVLKSKFKPNFDPNAMPNPPPASPYQWDCVWINETVSASSYAVACEELSFGWERYFVHEARNDQRQNTVPASLVVEFRMCPEARRKVRQTVE